MTDIFFISYQFPPLNVGGVFRPLKFVKYFHEFEIHPIIFTLSKADYGKIYREHKTDVQLLNEIKATNKTIIEVKSDELLSKRTNKIYSFFQIYFNTTRGNEHKKWKRNFLKESLNALKKYKPKVIFVTAPPFGIIELAVLLSRKTGIPLIIDMRDSLSMWVSKPYGSYFHYLQTVKKERKWFKHASKIITVTDQIVEEWKAVHKKKVSVNKYVVLPNGIDTKLNYKEFVVEPLKEKFVIGYVGSFYYDPISRQRIFQKKKEKKLHRRLQYTPRKEDWLYRSPFYLFRTLEKLFEKHPELKKKVFVEFVGHKPYWLDEMISHFSLDENVRHLGFLTYEQTVVFQKRCDTLLITSVKVINGEDYCIAGKSFDYISMGKPILGFVTEGAQKQFLERSGTGILCNPDNPESSAKILENVLINGIKLKPNSKYINQFQRRELTKKLSEIIHNQT